VLVWLGTAALRTAHEPDLQAWGQSRVLTLRAPSEEGALATAGHDDELASRVETLLADARTASYSADPGAAEKALSSAELLLRGNPELPEAPWLMAETASEHAALVKKTDPALAEILERRAVILGGQRAPAFTEATKPVVGSEKPNDAKTALEATPPAGTVAVSGPLTSDATYVDGVPAKAPLALEPGEHHLRVVRQGRLAWAGWVTLEGEAIRLPVPTVDACTPADLGNAHVVGDHVSFDANVLCPEWAFARDAGPAKVEVMVCRDSVCGGFLPWSRAWGETFEGRPEPLQRDTSGPSALVWAAVGVGAVLAGSFALWQGGAFDHDGSPRTTFRFTGPGAR
jgi:hypothetical protein